MSSKRWFKVTGSDVGVEMAIGVIDEDMLMEYEGQEEDELFENITKDLESPWDIDDVEHINSPFANGGFNFVEVDSDDYEISEPKEFEGYTLGGRERYITDGFVFDEQEPVMLVIKNEKGNFGHWIIETDGEDFNPNKFAFTVIENDYGEIVDEVWYDKSKIEIDQDWLGTDTKWCEAKVGWMDPNADTRESFLKNIDCYWEGYEDNLKTNY